MLSEKIIKEFQEVIIKEYGKNISLQEASRILNDLMGYFDMLSKINHDMQNGP